MLSLQGLMDSKYKKKEGKIPIGKLADHFSDPSLKTKIDKSYSDWCRVKNGKYRGPVQDR